MMHNRKLDAQIDPSLVSDAIALLKEQEPKPVTFADNSMTKLQYSRCPSCGEAIDRYLYGRTGQQVNYCSYCGQAVKWDD